MKKTAIIIFLFVTSFSYANTTTIGDQISPSTKSTASVVDYSIWEMMLKMYIDKDGNVDYTKFKKNEMIFDEFLGILANAKINDKWSENEKIAFWINVYNAYTIKLILNNYPTESIKDIKKPWDQKFFMIDGKYLSLGDVEHEILRKKFTEPRIHFAINCASRSCPRVIQIPYNGKNLDKLLERQTKEYINNPFVNDINAETYKLSKLFSWFSKDFKTAEGSVENFVNRYSKTRIESQRNKGFKEYNWELNKK